MIGTGKNCPAKSSPAYGTISARTIGGRVPNEPSRRPTHCASRAVLTRCVLECIARLRKTSPGHRFDLWLWPRARPEPQIKTVRSEEHTSELQSLAYLVCRLLLEKKK